MPQAKIDQVNPTTQTDDIACQLEDLSLDDFQKKQSYIPTITDDTTSIKHIEKACTTNCLEHKNVSESYETKLNSTLTDHLNDEENGGENEPLTNGYHNDLESNDGNDKEKGSMIALLQRTGYTMIQENGQRRYGGPPPGWTGDVPSRGCEIFVGKIPRDLYEDELVPLFERAGPLYELRLMMDFGGTNRGYAFVMYTCKEDARTAIRTLNNYEIRKGKYLGVCPSVDNCRLFVGGIPRDKTEGDVREHLTRLTEGVVNVILYPSIEEKTKNRGYAFVEYDCHKSAAMARRKLVPGKVQLWGKPIAVDWAEPEVDVDEEILKSVKILYVRNLMLSTSEDQIRQYFQNACNGDESCIERIKKIKDYAFIHYVRREDALCALEVMNGKQIDGSVIEVSLAKPIDQSYYNQYSPKPRIITNNDNKINENRSGMYSLNGRSSRSTFSIKSCFNDYGNHDDGSVTRAIRGAGGLRGNPLRLRGYRPQREKKLYENREKTNLIYGFSKQGDFIFGKSLNVLEDFCHKLGWRNPEYKVEVIKKTDSGNKDITLYIGQIRIIELNPDFLQASQMGLTAQEAKLYAADFMLTLLKSSLMDEKLDKKNYEGNPLYKLGEKGFVLYDDGRQNPSTSSLYSHDTFNDDIERRPGYDLGDGSENILNVTQNNRNGFLNVPLYAPQELPINSFPPYLPMMTPVHGQIIPQMSNNSYPMPFNPNYPLQFTPFNQGPLANPYQGQPFLQTQMGPQTPYYLKPMSIPNLGQGGINSYENYQP